MDKDTNQVSESQATETEKEQANLSRRRLLRASAIGAAAVPMMVTIRSASAHATGITKVNDFLSNPPEADVYGSISCISHVQMPTSNDDAVLKICQSNPDIKYKSRSQCEKELSNPQFSLTGSGGSTTTPTCEQLYEYYPQYTNYFNQPVFDFSNEKQCTYLEYTCSTGCLNSIVQQSSIYSGGRTSWPDDGFTI